MSRIQYVPEGVENPALLLFPDVVVCLDCGLAELVFQKAEVHSLAKGIGAQSADAA